jgi:hypothetical protein
VSPNLGPISPGELPAARPSRRELDADSEGGSHLELLRVPEDQLELVELLHDGDDRLPDLLREDDHLDVVVVLEAVADDRHVAAVRQREHGEELGLRAALEPKRYGLPKSRILLHDLPCWFTLIG